MIRLKNWAKSGPFLAGFLLVSLAFAQTKPPIPASGASGTGACAGNQFETADNSTGPTCQSFSGSSVTALNVAGDAGVAGNATLSGNLKLGGLATSVNGQATQGWGFPVIVAADAGFGLSASTSTVLCSYSPPNGQVVGLKLSGWLKVVSRSSGQMGMQYAYTAEGGGSIGQPMFGGQYQTGAWVNDITISTTPDVIDLGVVTILTADGGQAVTISEDSTLTNSGDYFCLIERVY